MPSPQLPKPSSGCCASSRMFRARWASSCVARLVADEAAAAKILQRLLDLGARVHDERPLPRDRLAAAAAPRRAGTGPPPRPPRLDHVAVAEDRPARARSRALCARPEADLAVVHVGERGVAPRHRARGTSAPAGKVTSMNFGATARPSTGPRSRPPAALAGDHADPRARRRSRSRSGDRRCRSRYFGRLILSRAGRFSQSCRPPMPSGRTCGISSCRMPLPDVIHWMSPAPIDPWWPSESRCSTSPCADDA